MRTSFLVFAVLWAGCGGPPEIALSTPDGIDFGAADVGSATTGVIRIKNTGASVLHLRAVFVEGAAKLNFTPGPVLQPDIEPGKVASLGVAFIPSGKGEWAANLRIESNAEEIPIWLVPLSGTGT